MTPAHAASPALEPAESPELAGLWADASLAAALFTIDPVGLGGVVVRGGPGPVRDRWLAMVRAILPTDAPIRRIPLGIEDDRLLGGLDLPASLSTGRPVVEQGVLAATDRGVAILSMAERIDDPTGARLAAVLDSGEVAIERDGLTTRLPARLGLIALDEGLEPDERPPEALLERLAFRVDLSDVSARAPLEVVCDAGSIRRGRRKLTAVEPPSHAIIEALCMAAAAMGLVSVRPPLLALKAARAHAALCGRTVIEVHDAAVAARLVLAPRALSFPASEPDAAPEDAEQPDAPSVADHEPDPAETRETESAPGADQVVEIIRAALPENLLEQIALRAEKPARSMRGRGSGAATKSSRRGRPVGSRPGALRPGDRLNLPATLRAATPWQKLRAGGPSSARVQVRPEDFRIRRFVQRRESTTIFVVDASGSAAFQRLAEAKGAVELLLAKAYVSRARVALVAFRKDGAEVLLAPTRSLARAKRSLADLPGGGGTPLAAGLEAALALALAEKAKDRTPLLVVLSDGRANIGLGGAPGRPAAEADALAAARRVRNAGVGGAFVDTSARPQLGGDRFALAMGAVYAPLPYVDAARVSDVVAGLQGGRT